MNNQLKLIGLSLMLAAAPMLAGTAQAQWSQQGQSVIVNLSDTQAQYTPVATQATPSATNTISLNQYGGVEGRVVSLNENSRSANGLGGLNVFFVRDGQVIKQAQTTADGTFNVSGLGEGAYSFYAAGKNGLAAYGVYVTSQQTNSQNLLTASPASPGYYGLQQLIQRNAPAQVVQSIQNALATTQGEAQPARQIRLINGRLYGQVSSLFSQSQAIGGLQVQLIQNSKPIAQVQTDANGIFNIPDVEPGVYDYVVGGSNGFAAGRFEATENTTGMKQVSYTAATPQLDCCLTCPNQGAQMATSQPVEYALGQDAYIEPSYANTASAPVEYAGESISYGGASGGACGACNNYTGFGGGGLVRGRFGGLGRRAVGGSGGLSRLITLGALGGGITAIADDDSDPATDN